MAIKTPKKFSPEELKEVTDLHLFYKTIWSSGDAGEIISIKVQRENKGEILIDVKSIDRQELLRKPKLNS